MRRSLFWLLDHYPETGESLGDVHRTALDHARLADGLGFESLWIAEHHFQKLGTAPNPAVVLAAIAQRTTSLRLGPAVSVLPLRHPTHVAEDYALLDVLSDGRLNMGVGTGSQQTEFAGFGIDFDARRTTFDAHLAALREHWTSRTLNVEPVQQPAPPIFVATLQEDTGTPDHVARQVERYASTGITHMAFISRFGGLPRDAAETTMRQLAAS